MAHDVFISYSQADKPVADAVCHRMEAAGVRCWIAPRDVAGGINWDDAVVEAITAAKVLVVIFSAAANASRSVLNEVATALDAGATIMPFRIENILPTGAMRLRLGRRHWIDALTSPLEAHIDRLIESARRNLPAAKEVEEEQRRQRNEDQRWLRMEEERRRQQDEEQRGREESEQERRRAEAERRRQAEEQRCKPVSLATLLDLRRTTVAETNLSDPLGGDRDGAIREAMSPPGARQMRPASRNHLIRAMFGAVAAAALATAVAWFLLRSKGVVPAPPPSLRDGSSLLPWLPGRRAIEASVLLVLAAAPQRRSGASPITDIVDVSAFAPEGGHAGDEVLVQIFLHRLRVAAVAEARARGADRRTARRGVATLASAIARGTQVGILLEATGLQIDEPLQSVVWEGRPCACQFIVTVPAEAARGPRTLRTRVLLNGAPIGRLCFSLEVLSPTDGTARPIAIRGDLAQRYRQAFLSYARQDRVEVVKRAQALRAVGVSFFQDILSVGPGEIWEKRLYREIDECDLFLLFWSSNAARSEWVLREAEYALNRQRLSSSGDLPDITPVILEGPPVPPPPDSLRHLHFDDYLRYFIADVESTSQAPALPAQRPPS